MIRLLMIIALAAALFAPAASAQEGKKCPTVHHGPIAIFVDPTHEEVEALKLERGAEDYSTIWDDNMWYDYQAMKYLEKIGVPFCSTTDEAHEFVRADGRRFSTDEVCPHWCMILWNGIDEPVYTYNIDIDTNEDYLKGE